MIARIILLLGFVVFSASSSLADAEKSELFVPKWLHKPGYVDVNGKSCCSGDCVAIPLRSIDGQLDDVITFRLKGTENRYQLNKRSVYQTEENKTYICFKPDSDIPACLFSRFPS